MVVALDDDGAPPLVEDLMGEREAGHTRPDDQEIRSLRSCRRPPVYVQRGSTSKMVTLGLS